MRACVRSNNQRLFVSFFTQPHPFMKITLAHHRISSLLFRFLYNTSPNSHGRILSPPFPYLSPPPPQQEKNKNIKKT